MQKFLDEYDYLIHLVRCAIHNLQPRELPEGMAFEQVYEWGTFHNVANIAFYSVEKLENKPKPQLYSRWEACRDQAIALDINQSFAAQELRDAMDNAGIRFLEVQGTKLKPLYPQPDFRTMSDLDFIIDPENTPKAKLLLEALGYEWKEIYFDEVNADRPPNIHVELHTEYFLKDCPYRPVLHSPFESMDEKGQCQVNAFYLYNLLHIAKHYFYSGCGIRRVLDAYYLNQAYGRSIDPVYVKTILERADAAAFADEFISVAQAWFGFEEQDLPRSEMMIYILNSGVHGSSYNLQKNGLEKTLRNATSFTKLKYLMGRFFGNREDLKIRYPVLERYKMLYPICWLRRIFCVLSPKEMRRIKREVTTVKNMTRGDAE